ncbi:UbiX family flavin prenyltransferase [Coriobacteriia bacterium Es71-Z0120]|uniref:UbiX family flavin prenyltransferase n=1 Tax=Parvivirga hydrogeniphila TaxID=2939460 RepID=UPI002260D87E|nr:UbiX family flavin prenyltransferase [Parvivirga hydrogeniphila]MCL4078911.1 UbiX family flavin prenyltransferase [Parvivirga hydrogeniphila]
MAGIERAAVIVTGASGSAYGLRTIQQLADGGADVVAIFTPTGEAVARHEVGLSLEGRDKAASLGRFLDLKPSARLRVADDADLFDPVASGSNALDAVIVVPASMGFVASSAAGLASDLAERVVDVALKERRPVVFVPRETPLHLIHLRNLTTLAEAGAAIVPAMPAYYTMPKSVDDMVDFVVGKVLDVLGFPHELFKPWRA